MRQHPEKELEQAIIGALAASNGDPMTQRELREVLTIESGEDGLFARALSKLADTRNGLIIATGGRYRLTAKGSATAAVGVLRAQPVVGPLLNALRQAHADLESLTGVTSPPVEDAAALPLEGVVVAELIEEEVPVMSQDPVPQLSSTDEPAQGDLRWVTPPVLPTHAPPQPLVSPASIAALRAIIYEVNRSSVMTTPDDTLRTAHDVIAKLRDRIADLEQEVGVLSRSTMGMANPRWVAIGSVHTLMAIQTVEVGRVEVRPNGVVGWTAGSRMGTISDTDPHQTDASRLVTGQTVVRTMLGLSS